MMYTTNTNTTKSAHAQFTKVIQLARKFVMMKYLGLKKRSLTELMKSHFMEASKAIPLTGHKRNNDKIQLILTSSCGADQRRMTV